MNGPRKSRRRGLGLWLFVSLAIPFPAAADPGSPVSEPGITDKERNHWSFQPLKPPAPPEVQNKSQVRNPVDQFVLQRLESRNLRFQPEASRNVLIRRATFDLTGLPPTPEEVEQFVNDTANDAYEQLIDRLLASPAYGERWAQHWLDLARFAETDGFEHDKIRPEAWRYRDWVIQALNGDVPYNRFIQMQIAGDELFPGDTDATVATGFLLSGPDMPDINDQEERRHTVLNEITSTVGASLLGLGLGCAQCHDHKYDPVSQADFYRMRAFFENCIRTERDRPLGPSVDASRSEERRSHVMIRGDFRHPGPEVQPAFLRIVDSEATEPGLTPEAPPSDGRAALATWLTQSDHPLALRVIANRLWQHHFGSPLVGTPNDFGFQGERPTHPDLLDWLATELVRRGWSLKQMHRLLLMSATYRQDSRGNGPRWERALALDPGNRLLSRMNRIRLDGETIRDAMLATSGALNRAAGGPGVRPPLSDEITVTLLKDQWEVTSAESDHFRRSIYIFARRNMRYPLFDVFDRPDANASCARRHVSTTAPQSLTLLNSEFSLEMARRIAGRANSSVGADLNARVTWCYLETLARRPTAEESELAIGFLKQQSKYLEARLRDTGSLALPTGTSEDSSPYREAAFVDFCLALFNLNEFVYLD